MKSIALSALALTLTATQVANAQAPSPQPKQSKQEASVQRWFARTQQQAQQTHASRQRAQQPRAVSQPAQQFASPRAQEFRQRQFNADVNRSPRVVTSPAPGYEGQQRVFTPNTAAINEAGRRNWRNRDVDADPNAPRNNSEFAGRGNWRNRGDNVDPDDTRTNSEFADRGNWQERNRDGREWNRQNWRGRRNWDRTRRSRGWWRSNYSRFALFGGGYYYWDQGYWYPAYGYDPYFSSYTYDAPIYGYNNQDPGQVIAGVQSALQQNGYYRGEVDGTYGPMTRRALLTFQRDNGLPQTGQIDQDTLGALGME